MNATSVLPLSDLRHSAYSMMLPDALDAQRLSLHSAKAGTVAYYQDISAGGRPLVLVHSINAAPSAFEMRPLFEHYRVTRPVYALELPGFGFSDRSNRRYAPELFAGAIKDFLTEIVSEPCDLVALSLSAEFAARAALEIPQNVASLVLISPTGFSKRSLPSPATQQKVHKGLSLPYLSQGLYSLLTTRVSIGYFLRKSFEGDPPQEMIDYAYATSHQPGARYAPLYFLSGQLFTENAAEKLYARLSLPVLVLKDRDPNISFDLLPKLVADHPNWRTETIAPTQGLPHWEKPAETTAAIDKFWASRQQD